MIKVEKLKKYYGKHKGIENISFSVKEGEIYGLIGPNGSGKTTTIRILTGLLKNDSGEAFIRDFKMPDKIDNIKKDLGYLPGEVNYYSDMRVKDLISFNRNFYKNIDIAYEKNIIDNLQIDVNKKFKELSMGNKKKVGILQTFVHKPKYLILDEPTNGLDPLLQQKLYDMIKKEKEKNNTILFSSHNLSEVEKICDRVGILKEGEVIKEYEVDDLINYTNKLITIYGLKNSGDFKKRYKNSTNPDGSITFDIVKEDFKRFLNEVSSQDFIDLEMEKPKLEDVFIEYYK